MLNIEELKFDEKGLIPAIVVDYATKKVLTLAYMNKESLKISLEKGLTCFYSRSRQELWLKGETSGNYQHIVSITADCDKDALTVVVKKDGPACHTGTDSCFNDLVYENEELNIHGSRNALKDDFVNNIELVASGKADVMKMVSGIYDMDNALDAFKALANNDGTLAKLLIKIGD